jgi:hypothetical protein
VRELLQIPHKVGGIADALATDKYTTKASSTHYVALIDAHIVDEATRWNSPTEVRPTHPWCC